MHSAEDRLEIPIELVRDERLSEGEYIELDEPFCGELIEVEGQEIPELLSGYVYMGLL